MPPASLPLQVFKSRSQELRVLVLPRAVRLRAAGCARWPAVQTNTIWPLRSNHIAIHTVSGLQVLVLPKTTPLNGADLRLLSDDGFQAHSATALRTLMHAGPGVQPLLHHFKRLKQVLCRGVSLLQWEAPPGRTNAVAGMAADASLPLHPLAFSFRVCWLLSRPGLPLTPCTLPLLCRPQVALFCTEQPGQPPRSIDATVFQQLPKLNCLTVAGRWRGREAATCGQHNSAGVSCLRCDC